MKTPKSQRRWVRDAATSTVKIGGGYRAENARLQEQLDDAQTNVKALMATVDSVRADNERLAALIRCHHDQPCTAIVLEQDREIAQLRAENERIKAARLQHSSVCEGSVGLPCDMPTICDPLRAACDRLREALTRIADYGYDNIGNEARLIAREALAAVLPTTLDQARDHNTPEHDHARQSPPVAAGAPDFKEGE